MTGTLLLGKSSDEFNHGNCGSLSMCAMVPKWNVPEVIFQVRAFKFGIVRGIHWWPVDSPLQGPETRSFYVCVVLGLGKLLIKQSSWWWLETWHSCDVTVVCWRLQAACGTHGDPLQSQPRPCLAGVTPLWDCCQTGVPLLTSSGRRLPCGWWTSKVWDLDWNENIIVKKLSSRAQ